MCLLVVGVTKLIKVTALSISQDLAEQTSVTLHVRVKILLPFTQQTGQFVYLPASLWSKPWLVNMKRKSWQVSWSNRVLLCRQRSTIRVTAFWQTMSYSSWSGLMLPAASSDSCAHPKGTNARTHTQTSKHKPTHAAARHQDKCNLSPSTADSSPSCTLSLISVLRTDTLTLVHVWVFALFSTGACVATLFADVNHICPPGDVRVEILHHIYPT